MRTCHALVAILVSLAGCATTADPVGIDPGEAAPDEGNADEAGAIELPEPRCDGLPDAGDAGSWRLASEDQPVIDRGDGVGLTSYVDLLPAFESMPPAP